jgi:hypothetical protein
MALPSSSFEETSRISIVKFKKSDSRGKQHGFSFVSGESSDQESSIVSADVLITQIASAIPEFKKALAKREREAASAAVINSRPEYGLVQEKIADLIETRKEVVEIHNRIMELLPEEKKSELRVERMNPFGTPSDGFPTQQYVLDVLDAIKAEQPQAPNAVAPVAQLYEQRDALLSTMKDQAAAYFESVRAAFPKEKLPAVETNPASDFRSKATDAVEINLQHVGFVPHARGAKSSVVTTCINHLNAALLSGKVDHTALPFDVLPPETGHAANANGRRAAGAEVC